MAFTNTAAENVLKGFLGLNTGAILGKCYLGLSTTAPSSDGTGFTEPSSSAGYGRVEMTNKIMTVTEAENEVAIMFPEATSSWGTVRYFGLFASENPTALPLIYGALTSQVTISANYIALFRPGNFTMSLT